MLMNLTTLGEVKVKDSRQWFNNYLWNRIYSWIELSQINWNYPDSHPIENFTRDRWYGLVSPLVAQAPLSAYSILYEVSCFCTDIIRNDSRLVICLAFSLLAASLVAAMSIPLIFVWFRIPPNPNYSWCLNPMLQDFEQPRSATNQAGPWPSSHWNILGGKNHNFTEARILVGCSLMHVSWIPLKVLI